MSYAPCLRSLPCLPFPVLRLCFLSFALFALSNVSVPCLLSAVPSLTSLILVSHPLSPVLRLCSLSPVLFTLSHVICPLSPILLSPSPHPHQLSQCPLYCGSITLFLSFVPLFLSLLSSVPCLSYW
jgi:hypothetical protein